MFLPPGLRAQIAAHAAACLPEEACGLIGGREGKGELAIEITNELHSPTRFRMLPIEQFRAFMRFEAEQLDLLAIYHSHPNGPPGPSATDAAEFNYPGVLYLILSPSGGGWQVRAFRFEDGAFTEVELSG